MTPFTEDLSVFFNEDEFADSAVIDGATVLGIFDAPYAETLGADAEVPTLLVRDSDIAGVERGAEVTVKGKEWTVQGIHPDGTGLSMLMLQEAANQDGVAWNFSQPYYQSPDGTLVADHAIIQDPDTGIIHKFGITGDIGSAGARSLAHFITLDPRLGWTRLDDVRVPTDESGWAVVVWAPQVIENPNYDATDPTKSERRWIMFFTGHDATAVGPETLQKIGACWTNDLHGAWEPINDGAPIYWYAMPTTENPGGASWAAWTTWSHDCRDPYVYLGDDGSWYMLTCGKSSADAKGIIGLAVCDGGGSPDWTSWEHGDAPIFHQSTASYSHACEAPHVLKVEHGGAVGTLWHLFFTDLDGTRHQSAAAVTGPWLTGDYAGYQIGRALPNPVDTPGDYGWTNSGTIGDAAAELAYLNGEWWLSRHRKRSPWDYYVYEASRLDFDDLGDHASGKYPADIKCGNVGGLIGTRRGEPDATLTWAIGDSGGEDSAFYFQPIWGDNPVFRDAASSRMRHNSYIATYERHFMPDLNDTGWGSGWGSGGTWPDFTRVGWKYTAKFTITKTRLELLVGGGEYPDEEFVALVRASDNKVLFQANGADSHTMSWACWDLTDLIGTEVYLVAADLSTDDQGDGMGGCIAVDAIREYTPDAQSPDKVTPISPATSPADIAALLGEDAPYAA